MQTRLIRIDEVDESDWGYDDFMYAKLMLADKLHAPVTVVSREVNNGDPHHDYYNVRLADGTVFPAVSGMHLEGIQHYMEAGAPQTLTCQYLVELKVASHREGEYLDHDTMATAINGAVATMLEGSGFAGYTTTVGNIICETEFYEGN